MLIWQWVLIGSFLLFVVPIGVYLVFKMATLGILNAKKRHNEDSDESSNKGKGGFDE